MSSIFYALTIALLLINLAGLSIAALRLIPHFAIALTAGIVGGAATLFFVEHFIGLGKLAWLWPLTSAASALALYRYREQLLTHKSDLAVFSAAFVYSLGWRWLFPDIGPSSEHIPDLYYIGNYLPGSTLPPPDNWLPPQTFNFYYAFQHYAAAVMGRVLGLDAGTTYNLALCVLFALIISCAWFTASRLVARKWHAWLVVAALAIGGSGISPFYHLLFQADPAKPGAQGSPIHAVWASTRFIGLYDKETNTPLAEALIPKSTTVTTELPLETLAYTTNIGDFHPPLGGFLLLLLTLACMVAMEKTAPQNHTGQRVAQALLGLSVPLSLIVNTWIFPLQGLLVGGWALLRKFKHNSLDWKILLVGAGAGFALIMPFMIGFAGQSATPVLRWLEVQDRVPAIKVVLLMWPMFALTALGIWQVRSRPIALLLILIIVAVFSLTQLVYVDDGTNGGLYKRFNTTLKWWSWIYLAALVGLGAHNLGSSSAFVRYGTVTVLLLLCTHGYDQARYALFMPKPSIGKLHGHHWLSNDYTQRDMLSFLQAAPAGIVLESLERGGYSPSTALTLFAGKTALLGWPDHLAAWKKPAGQILRLHGEIKQFYGGQKIDALEWLKINHVNYIVWNQSESQNAAAYDLIQNQISSHYHWKPFYENGATRAGLWIKK
jgi:uncharacterized membrane protein